MNTYQANIRITLRKVILDVQGKAVESALHSIDFQMLKNVRIGKYVELSVDAESKEIAQGLIDDACKKLITNPIIEDFEVEINL
jgi:phosphoribosylformylglycinamidine synthase subunit PurS